MDRRSGEDVQSRHPGLDELLWSLLRVGLYPTLRHLNRSLARWAMAKYKPLKRHRRQAEHWVRKVSLRDPARG
jgi:RNA-directed DNA polymerase